MEFGEWLDTDLAELLCVVGATDPVEGEALASAILGADRLFVAGLGRSGLVMRMFALRLMQLGLCTYVVGDATTPAIGDRDLLIVGSASGETEGALLTARQARGAGASVAAITARAGSSLAQIADHLVAVRGTTPKAAGGRATSALPLATVLEQAYLVVTDCLIARLADRLGRTGEAMMSRHANLE